MRLYWAARYLLGRYALPERFDPQDPLQRQGVFADYPSPSELPATESLEDCVARTLPFWCACLCMCGRLPCLLCSLHLLPVAAMHPMLAPNHKADPWLLAWLAACFSKHRITVAHRSCMSLLATDLCLKHTADHQGPWLQQAHGCPDAKAS